MEGASPTSTTCRWLANGAEVAAGACDLDGRDVTLAPGDGLQVEVTAWAGELPYTPVSSEEGTLLDHPVGMVVELIDGSIDWIDAGTGQVQTHLELHLTDDDIDIDAISEGTPQLGMPMRVNYAPAGDVLHASSCSYGVIWELDPVNRSILDWHRISPKIYWYLYSDDATRMYVTDSVLDGVDDEPKEMGGVTEVDLATWTNLRQAETGIFPIGLTEDDNGWFYVPHHKSPNTTVVDKETMEVVAQLDTPNGPYFATISPTRDEVWIACEQDNEVWVFSIPELEDVAHIPVGLLPNYVWFTPDGKKAYVSNFDSGSVSVVDVATKTETFEIDTSIGSVAVVPRSDGRYLYIPNVLSYSMSVIDTVSDQVVAEWSDLGGPRWLEWTRE